LMMIKDLCKKICIVVVAVVLLGAISFCGNSSKKEDLTAEEGRETAEESEDEYEEADESKKKSYADNLGSALRKGRALGTDTQTKAVKSALEMYYADNNGYPNSLEELIPTYLVSRNDILDRWGTPMELQYDEENNPRIVSAGQDKVFGNDDDISRRI
ncbi:MAG: hypothetical protein GY765_37705, partial [bacterium]|nr:hypothetical protein [bacterium]